MAHGGSYFARGQELGVLEELKRRVYLGAMGLVFLAAGIGFVFDETGAPVSAVSLLAYGPGVALYAAGIFLCLWRRWAPMRNIEWAVFVGASAFLLTHIGLALFHTEGSQLAAYQFTAFAPWVGTAFLIAFVMLDTREAVRGALILYLAMIGLAVTYVATEGISRVSRFELNSLVQQFLLANAFYIALLYVMARTKEEYGKAEAQRKLLDRLAHTDELTGLPNRRHVIEAGKREIERLARTPRPFSVVLFDIDHFKKVNDTYGHPVGDQVLSRLAEVVRSELRAADELGRFGGEEFIVLAFDSDEATAVTLAERLRESIETDNADLPRVTASFGVAAHEEGDDLKALISRADACLYRAKEAGRNRVQSESRIKQHPPLESEDQGAQSAE